METPFFKRISIAGFILAAIASCLFLFTQGWLAFAGVWVGSVWIFLNFWILFQILNISFIQHQAHKKKITLLLMIKFPVLYVGGFFILIKEFFPLGSVLTGLTVFFVTLAIGWILVNFQKKQTVRSFSLFALLTSLSSFLLPLASWATEAAHEVVKHVDTPEKAKGPSLHILNFIHLVTNYLHESPVTHFLHRHENTIFNVIVICLLTLLFSKATKKLTLVPGRLQSALESIVEMLNGFVSGILGPQGRKYTPFLGTLFIYILCMNMMGLVPLMKSPTAHALTLTLGVIQIPVPTVTAALAILVFFYVQSIGIKTQGIGGYLYHMIGSPKDIFGYVLAPLMLVIHVIGEFAKPLSLAFRLYGNIWGEDVLLAVFMGLGVGMLAFLPIPSGVPIHFPFLFLAMVTGTIQAFVFTLLSTVYIAMMLPHEHPEEHGAEAAHS